MKRHNLVSQLASGIAVLGLLLSLTSSAHAWTKVKNNWHNTIHVAYAYASVSGFLCGYKTCGGQGIYRVQGWWNIAPGQTATVNSNTHYNATHYFWAFDDYGYVWSGDAMFGIFRPQGFNYCKNNQPPGTEQQLFFNQGVACCGFNCPGPSNATVTLY